MFLANTLNPQVQFSSNVLKKAFHLLAEQIVGKPKGHMQVAWSLACFQPSPGVYFIAQERWVLSDSGTDAHSFQGICKVPLVP